MVDSVAAKQRQTERETQRETSVAEREGQAGRRETDTMTP